MGADEVAWRIVRLAKRHVRDDFDSGHGDLDTFLRTYARQNDEKGVGRTYVAIRPGEDRIYGYFTLRRGAVAFASPPDSERRGLPRYPVPVVHLGRLAVDRRAQGKGLGEKLLVGALERALEVSTTIGVAAVEVIAKNERARTFYRKYGFVSLLDDALHMYLSIKAIRRAFEPGRRSAYGLFLPWSKKLASVLDPVPGHRSATASRVRLNDTR